MRIFLEETSEKRYEIKDTDDVTVTREELESVGGPIAFIGIKVLTIEEDIDWALFAKYIDEIVSCKTVVIPKTLSRLQVLTKCRNVGKVIRSD
jgi:hypothetical protein